jgi:hypothetical protein
MDGTNVYRTPWADLIKAAKASLACWNVDTQVIWERFLAFNRARGNAVVPRGFFWASCAGGGLRPTLLRNQMCLRYRSGPRRKNWSCIDLLPLLPARTGSFMHQICAN